MLMNKVHYSSLVYSYVTLAHNYTYKELLYWLLASLLIPFTTGSTIYKRNKSIQKYWLLLWRLKTKDKNLRTLSHLTINHLHNNHLLFMCLCNWSKMVRYFLGANVLKLMLFCLFFILVTCISSAIQNFMRTVLIFLTFRIFNIIEVYAIFTEML